MHLPLACALSCPQQLLYCHYYIAVTHSPTHMHTLKFGLRKTAVNPLTMGSQLLSLISLQGLGIHKERTCVGQCVGMGGCVGVAGGGMSE